MWRPRARYIITCLRRVKSIDSPQHFLSLRLRAPCIARLASMAAPKKRKSAPLKAESKPKRSKSGISDYHLTPSRRDEHGEIIWPAPKEQMDAARAFILECVEAKQNTLLVPDKDADGLSSGVILHRTLVALGLPSSTISTHHLCKGTTIHDESERVAMASHNPAYIFVLDQGSRPGPSLIDQPHKAIILDHHFTSSTSEYPEGASFVNACASPPVATTSLLTYTICSSLYPAITDPDTAWLCALGTHGDLGSTFRWESPFPDMTETFAKHAKSNINEAISLINAPRRSATFDPSSSWSLLLDSPPSAGPKPIISSERLRAARTEVARETERCTHTPPTFSADSTLAVLRISSPAQVHPVIATRWAGTLSSTKLKVVMCANDAYLPGKVNFSCRIARRALKHQQSQKQQQDSQDAPSPEDVDIIAMLKSWARDAGIPPERTGHSFARGHPQASGGIVDTDVFDDLMAFLEVGKAQERKKKLDQNGASVEGGGNSSTSPSKLKPSPGAKQANKLTNYFSIGGAKSSASVAKKSESITGVGVKEETQVATA